MRNPDPEKGGYRAVLAREWLTALVGEHRFDPPEGWRPLWRTPEEAGPDHRVVGPAADGNLWARAVEVCLDGTMRYHWAQVPVGPEYLDEFALLAGWTPCLDD